MGENYPGWYQQASKIKKVVFDASFAISNDANAEYYDANGLRTNGLQKGLNIVKRGSKTYKIMVK